MSELKLNASQEAALNHLKEYLDDIATVTDIAVAAGADLSLYNSLCAKLKPRTRGKPFLSHVA